MKKFETPTLLFLLLFITACSQQTTPNDTVAGEILEETAVNPVLSAVTPPSRLLPSGTKSLTFTVTTQEPSIVKADSSNKSYSSMSLKASSSNGTTHNFTVSLNPNQPYSFFIKAAPKSNPLQPYTLTRKVNYRVLTPYEPTFPRIFTLWWPVWGEWDNVTADKLSKLSVFIVNLHGYNRPDGFQPIDPKVFSSARQSNPSLKLLTQLYSTVGCANETLMCEELERIDQDPKHRLYRKIFIRNADGSLWQYGLPESWAHPVYNFGNPETVRLLVEKNLQLWRTDLLTFDGAFMDNCWRGLEGVRDGRMIEIDKEIDLDLNGVADNPVTRDRQYEYGLQDFLKGLRAGMPNAVILCNAVGGEPDKTWLHTPGQPLKDRQGKPFNYASVLNGQEFEGDTYQLALGDYWQTFDTFFKQYTAWCKAQFCMTMVPAKGGEAADGSDSKNFNNYKAMRFALATALMTDGLYLYNVYADWAQNSWFDEYEAELGYATQGVGAPIASGSPVWRRNFDNGVALVNTSMAQTVTVNLGGTYKALQGTQDPSVNNGKTMTKITLPPLDGRILLKP